MSPEDLAAASRLMRLRLADRPSARAQVVRRIKARWRLELKRRVRAARKLRLA